MPNLSNAAPEKTKGVAPATEPTPLPSNLPNDSSGIAAQARRTSESPGMKRAWARAGGAA